MSPIGTANQVTGSQKDELNRPEKSADSLAGRTVFLYVVRGDLSVEGVVAPAHHLVACSNDGDVLQVQALGPARLLFGHAEPLREPIVSHGPFVMNSMEEIQQALSDYRAGLFGGLPQTSG